MSYSVMLGATESTWRDELKIRNSALIDGVHHAREMTTVSQSVFSMLHLLYSYERGDQATMDLLESSVVVYVPIVNVDGVAQIDQWYYNSGNLYTVRKNRRTTGRCAAADQGVDLNRNYSFRFNYDNEGSSSDVCMQDYRGSSAFSEPETQAMRDHVRELQNVKIALNLHAYGSPTPLWIHPFCYTSDKSNPLLANSFAYADQFYKEIATSLRLKEDYDF